MTTVSEALREPRSGVTIVCEMMRSAPTRDSSSLNPRWLDPGDSAHLHSMSAKPLVEGMDKLITVCLDFIDIVCLNL